MPYPHGTQNERGLEMTMEHEKRPTGVTIVGVLDLIGGIFSIFGGLTLSALGAFMIGFPGVFELPPGQSGNLGGLDISPELYGTIFLAFGVFLVGLGIAFIFAAYGTFKGKEWAWYFNVVLAWISIATNAGSLVLLDPQDSAGEIIGGAIPIAIDAVILYYLYRPRVKAFFGRTEPATLISG